MGNVQVNWPKLFQVYLNLFSCMRSFNHSTSAHVKKSMHIGAKLLFLEHFEHDKITKMQPRSVSDNSSIPPTWRITFFFSLTDFSKCSKSHNFASIGSMHNVYLDGFTVYIHADVE